MKLGLNPKPAAKLTYFMGVQFWGKGREVGRREGKYKVICF